MDSKSRSILMVIFPKKLVQNINDTMAVAVIFFFSILDGLVYHNQTKRRHGHKCTEV